MATFQVLCPNGRRQNVKLNQNAKLLQVLEDVCQKQKFLPAEDYKLVQGRKTLDLTLSVRYANLPNNAKLELVRAEKSRAETDVMIALQIETGERLQQEFNPATSLWDILLFWEHQPDSSHKGTLSTVDRTQSPSVQPVCIYLQEEVIGELALKETSLRSLGLTGGKAVLRLLHRPVEDQVLADIAIKIEKEKLRKARLEQSSTGTATGGETVSKSEDSPRQDNVQMQDERTSDAEMVTSSSELRVTSGSTVDGLETGADIMEPGSKVVRFGGSSGQGNHSEQMDVEQPAMETQMETDDSTPSEGSSQPVTSRSNAVDRLRGVPGVQVFTPDDFNDLSPQEQEIARRLAQSFFNQGGAQNLQQFGVHQKASSPQEAPFANFKFPEETKGQNLYHNELSSVRKQEFQPCERNTKVFSLEDRLSQDSMDKSQALPDEFFEITESDMRSLLAAQRTKLKDLEDQPLMTSAMRRAQLEAAYSRYKKVAIRVYFPDKLVLQGLFRPREAVFALKTFVKQQLAEPNLQFYCYTSPPKHVLEDDTQTLIEAHLVPATVVYFGSKEQRDHYLSEEALSKRCSKLEADVEVAQCLPDTTDISETSSSRTMPDRGSHSSASRSAPSSSISASSTPAASSSASGDKPMPKWLKLSKK